MTSTLEEATFVLPDRFRDAIQLVQADEADGGQGGVVPPARCRASSASSIFS